MAMLVLSTANEATLDGVIGVVSDHCRDLLGADDAGVLLLSYREGEPDFPPATGDRVKAAHRLQVQLQEGPCLDAIDRRATYITADATTDDRWPAWGPRARDLGIRSTIGVRLTTRDRCYGSLNVYSNDPDAFNLIDAATVEVIAAHASVSIAIAVGHHVRKAELGERTAIGQAQGILMEKFGIERFEAVALLRSMSLQREERLVAVAGAIVEQTEANAHSN